MDYTKLPPVKKGKKLALEHFPNRFYAAVFRLWETVFAERIAFALDTSVDKVKAAAADMGMPEQKNMEKWGKHGYITTIRNVWHILPYEQLIKLLGWNEEQLATTLKEDDFLDVKLGGFKPDCEPVRFEEPDEEQKSRLFRIKSVMQKYFGEMFDGEKPFDFFGDNYIDSAFDKADGLRMIYSYCGLYAGVLDNDVALSYPDELLRMYRSAGVNAVWLPVVLYQMLPFPFAPEFSQGWEQRIRRLKELVAKAKAYDIAIYLYINEPRCMPLSFFEKYPAMKGRTMDMYAALCTSNPAVLQYLRDAIRMLCENVPELGGFITITCSENLTHCKSREEGEECARCKNVPVSKLVADVLCAISEESRKVNPRIRTIAWTWAWDHYMTKEEIADCIDRLPREIVIQSNSEIQKEFTIGGVTGNVRDYSMSIPGPGPLAKYIWEYARAKDHEVSAKVQVNVTWECSTVPFLPVFDLVREHMTGLNDFGVQHLVLSWTLGGYPSVNLKVASSCLLDPSEERYDLLLFEEFGEYADCVKKAAKMFSDAFREFPFHLRSLYLGPQNAGPSNLLYLQPSGFEATMTCYAYDDLDNWRAIYPREIYINQLRKLRDGWRRGLEEIEHMPDCMFKQAALGGYALFNSSYLQAEFIDKRSEGDSEYLIGLVQEEKKMALLMYELMQKSSLFGYEAANHYYFNKAMLAEKVINCEYISGKLAD
ncbi:MAG: hypothetical protein IKU65_01900 [Oscillospiraceae bacterium]|nr:hypothetical protein [Oscillospiraceae bacterium]